jgi:hypothetical protein
MLALWTPSANAAEQHAGNRNGIAKRTSVARDAHARSRNRVPVFFGEMEDRAATISALLHEAGETHHLVYRIVDGNDPDWASWYADWLVDHSELPEILGTTPVRSELVWLLVSLDKEYTRASPDASWPDWYASRVIEHLGAAG